MKSTWLPRSSGFTPFFAAITVSPSKYAVPELLRARIGGEVRRAVLVAVRMAIKASRALAGNRRAAILGRVELLLREGRQQKAQPFQLPGREYPVEHLVVIRQRDQLTLRDVTQVRTRRQVNGRRKLGQEVIRQVEIYVEPRQVARVLLLERVDQKMRKDKAAIGVFGMRQRIETFRI